MVDPFFSKMKRDYWAQGNSSPMHELTSLGEKLGGIVQFTEGNTVNFFKPGNTPQGGQAPISCRAVWRDNLIAWRVRPMSARTASAYSNQNWYDSLLGQWKATKQEFNLPQPWGSATSGAQDAAPAATESQSGQDNEAGQTNADASYFGNGRIVINGEPAARAFTFVQLVGARPGVDGIYYIITAEHQYSRQGYVTWLDVIPWSRDPGEGSISSGYLPKPGPNIG